MAEQRYPSPPPSGLPGSGSAGCPPVADLILFALDQVSAPERRRIENHLSSSNCLHCQGWVNRTRQVQASLGAQAGPKPSPSFPVDSFAFVPTVLTRSGTSRSSASSQWQKKAFQELERRLQELEGE